MKDVRMIVGDFFEKKVANLFNLSFPSEKNPDAVPDLISRDSSFYVEVKASSYTNGGVINERQLLKFNRGLNIRRFYAFVYHSIQRNMRNNYLTGKDLKSALDLRSLFLFPFSIIKAYFDNSPKRKNPRHDTFVQLRESKAKAIFEGDRATWAHLRLCYNDYKLVKPHKKIHILTRNEFLEQKILSSLYLESL